MGDLADEATPDQEKVDPDAEEKAIASAARRTRVPRYVSRDEWEAERNKEDRRLLEQVRHHYPDAPP